jgi:uncharacterized protein YkwD
VKKTAAFFGMLCAGLMTLAGQFTDGTTPETPWEAALAHNANQARMARKKTPLQPDLAADLIARQHARDIAMGRVPFGHDGFAERTAAWSLATPGLKSFGENVHRNLGVADPVGTAIEAWKKSRPHRRNLLGDFTRVGSGVARDGKGEWVFVQLYAK